MPVRIDYPALRAFGTVFLALTWLSLAEAQDEPSFFESHDPPRGGYSRTIEVQRQRRQAILWGAYMAPPRNEHEAAIPALCVSFRNVNGPFPAAKFQSDVFGDPSQDAASPPHKTMRQYYRDVSFGQWLVSGHVLINRNDEGHLVHQGWYQLPHNAAYYATDRTGSHGLNDEFFEMLTDAFRQADQSVDFSQFDNDGPDGRPNSGDDDGKVDFLYIIHPKAGAESGGSFPIRSHRNAYSRLNGRLHGQNREQPFRTNDERTPSEREIGPDGQWMLPEGDPRRFITIEDYCLIPALDGPPADDQPPQICRIGVPCHEFGHILRLPDLYDRTLRSNGIGHWCLMSYGTYGGDGQHSHLPVGLSAWCRYFLGWADVEDVTHSQVLALEPVEKRGRIYRIPLTNDEYLLLEYRDKDWSDPQNRTVNWDATLPSSGVAVWHIDETIGRSSADWPMAPFNKGQNDFASLPDNLPRRALVALEQADQQLHLETKTNKGDQTDLWITGQVLDDDPGRSANCRPYGTADCRLQKIVVDLSMKTAKVLFKEPPQPDESPASEAADLSPALPDVIRDLAPPSQQPQPETLRRQIEALWDVDQKLARQEKLTEPDERVLRTAPDGLLRQAFGERQLLIAQRRANELRSQALADARPKSHPLNDQLMLWTRAQPTGANVRIVLDPSTQMVESLSGLSHPLLNDTVSGDAKIRAQSLGQLGGRNLTLTPKSKVAGEPTNPVTYEWTYRHGEQSLPVFGADATFYYANNDRLVGFRTQALDWSSLKIDGLEQGVASEAVKDVITRKLKIGPERVNYCRQGVYLVDDDPAKARLAHELCIAAGEGKEPIHIYFDDKTRTILEIK